MRQRTGRGILVFIGTLLLTTWVIGILAVMMGLPSGSIFAPANGVDFFIGVMEVGVGWYYARQAEKWYLNRGVHQD